MSVAFDVAGELYPIDDATASWLAAELRRLDLDGDELPGNMRAAAIQIEHALETSSDEPIRLTEREAVHVERLLDVGLTGTPTDHAARALRTALRQAFNIEP